MKLKWSSICPKSEAIHLSTVMLRAVRPRPEHTHDFYECFLVESGEGGQSVGGVVGGLKPGELHLVRPEHSHAFMARRGGILVFTNVALAAAVVETLDGRRSGSEPMWVPGEGPRAVILNAAQRAQFHSLVSEVGNSPRAALDADFFLIGLLRILRGAGEQTAGEGLPEWLREALPMASEIGNLRAGLPRLIQLCGCTPEHVSRCFRKHLGVSPTEWLNTERMRQARFLLDTSPLSIVEISYECGIESLSHFHRCFKAATGLTPRLYRKRASNVQDAV